MASEYFSTNMENGPQVKEALNKINKFYPELFSWIEINDTEMIDLKSPIVFQMDLQKFKIRLHQFFYQLEMENGLYL